MFECGKRGLVVSSQPGSISVKKPQVCILRSSFSGFFRMERRLIEVFSASGFLSGLRFTRYFQACSPANRRGFLGASRVCCLGVLLSCFFCFLVFAGAS